VKSCVICHTVTRTGWDMDPFVVVSFGKKVFRTRVIRHSLNPRWDEKLLFHVRSYESQFSVQFSVLDWDKLTSNDHIGDVIINVGELLKNAPKVDEKTGLYPKSADGSHDMTEFRLALDTSPTGNGTGSGESHSGLSGLSGMGSLTGTSYITIRCVFISPCPGLD
jgi:C2 domain